MKWSSLAPPDASGIIVWRENCTLILTLPSISLVSMETIISGETANISPFALFKWYEWVMYHDTSIPFPKEQLVLGWDLSPAIDIGPAMTQKILKANGKIVYHLTV